MPSQLSGKLFRPIFNKEIIMAVRILINCIHSDRGYCKSTFGDWWIGRLLGKKTGGPCCLYWRTKPKCEGQEEHCVKRPSDPKGQGKTATIVVL